MAEALPSSQIYQGPHELEKAWVSFQGDGKKMLILENGDKFMKDGLETKGPSLLVYWVYIIHKKTRKAE